MEHLDLTMISFNYTVLSSEYAQLQQLDVIDVKLNAISDILQQQHEDIEYQLEQHSTYVNSELSELETNQNNIDDKLDSLDTKQDELNMKVMSVSSELAQNVSRELKNTYDLLQEHDGYTCGGESGWRRAVYLNMTHPNTNCPLGWQLLDSHKRTCGRITYSRYSCDSVFFPVNDGAYNRVCGAIRAYQYGRTDAFEPYDDRRATTIDEAYVTGVSLTHGSPRQHIWTFAAGFSEDASHRDEACPCDATINIDIPAFVGGDYFCESGVNVGYPSSIFYADDPLWDGEGCTNTSTCCEFNNPPYFTKQLSETTTGDIEVRMCQSHYREDVSY